MTPEEIVRILQADLKDLSKKRDDLIKESVKYQITIEHIEYLIKIFKGTPTNDRNNKKNSN